MLFEKFLRKRKIPLYYLELVTGILFLNLIMLAILTIIEPLSINHMPFYVVALFIVTGAALLELLPVAFISFPLQKDRKKKCIVSQDIIILRYDDMPVNIPAFGTPGWNTLLGVFFKEPFLQIILFTGDPVGSNRTPLMPIKFFIPAVNFVYKNQNDYKVVKEEYKKTKEEAELYSDKSDSFFSNYVKGDGSIVFSVYLTYSKMNELNKLFELVNPPEFRITTYEKSGVFISIEPIPGKEYPPEALDCMEKINAMYP